jgi:hypothetical protein
MKIQFYEVGLCAGALLILGAGLQGAYGQSSEDAKAKAAQANCLSNVRQLGTSFLLYASDYDDVAFLSVPMDKGQYAPLRQYPTPTTFSGAEALGSGWLHGIYPYIMSRSMLVCPTAKKLDVSQEESERESRAFETSYAYNGLLHAFPGSKIVAPAELTVFWEGWGDTYDPRSYGANPQLLCHDGSPPCIYAGTQGPASVMFAPLGSMWIHNRGFNRTFADSSAKWQRAGAQTTEDSPGPPFTDYRVDPFTGYDEDGKPGWYWQHDLHPMVFAPDYDFGGHRVTSTQVVKPEPQRLRGVSSD